MGRETDSQGLKLPTEILKFDFGQPTILPLHSACSPTYLPQIQLLMAKRFYYLRDQVNALPLSQFKKLPNWLHTFKPTFYGEDDTPAVKLVCYLRGKPDVEYEAAWQAVNPDTEECSFRDLCQRTYDRVTSYLISDTHRERRPENAKGRKRVYEYSKAFRVQFDVRDHIGKAMMVNGYGEHQQAEYHLERAIRLGQKYELFDDLLTAANLLASLAVVTGNHEIREDSLSQIRKYKGFQAAYSEMLQLYGHYQQHTLYPDAPKYYDNVDQLLLAAQELEQNAPTPRVTWWFHRLRFEVFKNLNDHDQAHESANAMLEIALTVPAFKMPIQIGTAFWLVGQLQLEQGDYLGAQVSFEQAIPYFPKNHELVNTQYELWAAAHCYSNEPLEALPLIVEALAGTSREESPIDFALRSYKLAAIQLLCSQPKEAYYTLQDTTQLDEDKDGWNIAIRILAIMTLMERDKLDEASGQIKTLRDHVGKYRNENDIAPRMETIVEILHYWQFAGCHYALTAEHLKAELATLEAAENDHEWRPNTWELILFPQWFRSKAENKPYQFVQPPTANKANAAV